MVLLPPCFHVAILQIWKERDLKIKNSLGKLFIIQKRESTEVQSLKCLLDCNVRMNEELHLCRVSFVNYCMIYVDHLNEYYQRNIKQFVIVYIWFLGKNNVRLIPSHYIYNFTFSQSEWNTGLKIWLNCPTVIH